jgi:hypothetical protein
LFVPDFGQFKFVNAYVDVNPSAEPDFISSKVADLLGIATRQIGVIDISPDCTIDEVTDIFMALRELSPLVDNSRRAIK